MYERTFSEGIKAERERQAQEQQQAPEVHEGQGQLFDPYADETPTVEFDPIQPEPTRLQKLGNFVLRGFQAMGQSYVGYGSARMGYIPPRPPEVKKEEDEDDRTI